jgi:hypothetical protein
MMRKFPFPLLTCLLCILPLLSACNQGPGEQKTTISSTTTQSITYSTSEHDVIARTFTGGGLYGTFSNSPQISLYGDGTYTLGTQQEGKLSTSEVQQLLRTLVDTYELLNLKRQQFSDLPDQNTTYLELLLNGKRHELGYGSFGNQPESPQDMIEYHRLGDAITAFNTAFHGPTHPYRNAAAVLLVHQIYGYDSLQDAHFWQLSDFTLTQVASFECGSIPDDFDPNKEIACLKYTLPERVYMPDPQDMKAIRSELGNHDTGTFLEEGLAYEVTLRPLLPDELAHTTLAMFGSAQDSYRGIPLYQGRLTTLLQQR